MPRPSSSERIQQIADEFLSVECPEDVAQSAAVLLEHLSEAIDLGGLAGPEHAKLRRVVKTNYTRPYGVARPPELERVCREMPEVAKWDEVVGAMYGGEYRTKRSMLARWECWLDACERIGECLQAAAGGVPTVPGEDTCHVTLFQAAAVVNKWKRTLERWTKDDPDFPLPDVQGAGGTASEWKWSKLRPYLEKKTKRTLPERFPADTLRPDWGKVDT